MSNQNLSGISTAPKLEIITLSGEIKVVINEDIKDKIMFLCKNIAKDEWSGVLFYKVNGNIQNSDDMEIVIKDILLMDKGTACYTSFDWGEDVVSYQMDNPESMDWNLGHIHSHNTMSVFFSGVDWSELNDNSSSHNFYLSVIVNNYMDIMGKVAFVGKSQSFICKDKDGKDYSLKITGANNNPIMFVHDCKIIMNMIEVVIPDVFTNRLHEIEQKNIVKLLEEKRLLEKKQLTDGLLFPNTKEYESGKWDRNKEAQYAGWSQKGWKPLYESWNSYPEKKRIFETASNENLIKEEEEFYEETLEIQFATFVLRLGNFQENDTLEDALEDMFIGIESLSFNIGSLCDSIEKSYGALYDQFFSNTPEYTKDSHFIETLEKVIEALEEHEGTFDFLDKVTNTLKIIGNRFENILK